MNTRILASVDSFAHTMLDFLFSRALDDVRQHRKHYERAAKDLRKRSVELRHFADAAHDYVSQMCSPTPHLCAECIEAMHENARPENGHDYDDGAEPFAYARDDRFADGESDDDDTDPPDNAEPIEQLRERTCSRSATFTSDEAERLIVDGYERGKAAAGGWTQAALDNQRKHYNDCEADLKRKHAQEIRELKSAHEWALRMQQDTPHAVALNLAAQALSNALEKSREAIAARRAAFAGVPKARRAAAEKALEAFGPADPLEDLDAATAARRAELEASFAAYDATAMALEDEALREQDVLRDAHRNAVYAFEDELKKQQRATTAPTPGSVAAPCEPSPSPSPSH